jgi:hypothetical protein
MQQEIEFTISFSGSNASRNTIDLYDVSQALTGFQRSLALTTHLVLNDKIITQSPSLKGATILAKPPNAGSWELTAIISLAGTAIYKLGTTPKDSPIGHIIRSLYDYVISESLGFHVDYEKSLGQSYEELQEQEIELPYIEQSKADSLIEKCTTAVKDMHRPIYISESADSASIKSKIGTKVQPIGAEMNFETYEYIYETYIEESPYKAVGRVSSYNSNTYKGRIYVTEIGRPVAFELSENIRSDRAVRLITTSLALSAVREFNKPASAVKFIALRNVSRSGLLKSFTVLEVMPVA